MKTKWKRGERTELIKFIDIQKIMQINVVFSKRFILRSKWSKLFWRSPVSTGYTFAQDLQKNMQIFYDLTYNRRWNKIKSCDKLMTHRLQSMILLFR